MTEDMIPDDKRNQLKRWRSQLDRCCGHLREMAGATEHEFLAIGSRLQDIYMQFAEVSQKANQLAEVVSGVHITPLTEKLNAVIEEIDHYLKQTIETASSGSTFMDDVASMLGRIDNPLDSFKRMSKHLYMLEVSIKIESARLGEKGSEFINLAQDIKKLSLQVKDKATDISDNRTDLARKVKTHTTKGKRGRTQGDEAANTVRGMQKAMEELLSANSRFSELGSEVARVSEENSQYISSVVQSMQFHDIFRQQVEHVVEAIEPLIAEVSPVSEDHDSDRHLEQAIGKIGDVCELQEAQLQFAAGELYDAVSTILNSLQDINNRRHDIGDSLERLASEGEGRSFIDAVSDEMTASVTLLDSTSEKNAQTTATMQEMSAMVENMNGFVEVIKDIGSEIIQISLNARIKASGTGSEGDALSVLAEEIGQLSNEAVSQTTIITASLTEIHDATTNLTEQVDTLGASLDETLSQLKNDSQVVVQSLREMDQEITTLTGEIGSISNPLGKEIDGLCNKVNVHTKIKHRADEVLTVLREVFQAAREVCPASDEFKEDLRRMAEQYTMESERRIHEAISNRHGVEAAMAGAVAVVAEAEDDSEFGDNVDLF